MKYIIVGLGNFGGSLAEKLTQQGNEVIGIDSNMAKVDAYKSIISHTICIDSTDQFTMSGLPIKNTDVIIVAIGEDQGANIMTTAVMKNLKAKILISRAISPLHETILQAIGVDEIVHPEEETAERWAKKLCIKGVVDSFELNGEYSIVEVTVPKIYVGKTLGEINFRKNHDVIVLTTITITHEKNLIGLSNKVSQVKGVASRATLLNEGDIMVIYGSNKDIKKLLEFI
ncbi:MAG: potassium transporter TrkA [Bacteroidetes bacterium RIFCSPLOWO2_12_FULL_31_6]|nr:MAG: potassium transporter TrkA [Bacteroidetes bacterium RIFCSPLOWO2_12_FULL_31_6]